MKKKIIGLALSLSLLLGALPVSTQAATKGLTPAVAKAYQKVLEDCIASYGTSNAADSTQASSTGLVHSSLVDFDGDGTPELYMLYIKNQDYYPVEPGVDKPFVVTQEIWQDAGGTARRLYQEDSYFNMIEAGDAVSDDYIRLLPLDGKVYLVHYTEGTAAGLTRYVGMEVMRLQNGSMNKYLSVEESVQRVMDDSTSSMWDNPNANYSCIVNGQTVSEQAVLYDDSIPESRSPDIQAYYDRYPVWDQNAVIYSNYYTAVTRGEKDGITWQRASVLEELRAAAKKTASQSPAAAAQTQSSAANISIDYSKTLSFKTIDEYTAYLETVLKNARDEMPNDAAKRELAAYSQNAVTALSTGSAGSRNNKTTIRAGNVTKPVKKALLAKKELCDVLDEHDISLNKQVNLIVRVTAKMNTDKPMQVTLDKSLANSLDGASLQVVLGDGNHGLLVSETDLKTLLSRYGALTVQLSETADGQYTVRFLDEDGKALSRITAPVTLTLPASSELSTVLATYADGSDNWGGQFDEANDAISFETTYSGAYQIIENAKNITDISGLSQEEQNAVRFMVSKGYFTLDGSGAFRPDALLTRYDFTAGLVGMFFALDRELKTSFPDVPQESVYYAQVASAQAGNIVNGFDDGTFGGDKNITAEQVLALAARTLADKKGYAYPENPADYLVFPGAENVSQWAQQAVALAARENIAAPNESVDPTEAISRSDAALYLYRLFMLLYEVSPVEMNAAFGSSLTPTMAAAAAAVLLAAALTLLWRKKVRVKADRTGSEETVPPAAAEEDTAGQDTGTASTPPDGR